MKYNILRDNHYDDDDDSSFCVLAKAKGTGIVLAGGE